MIELIIAFSLIIVCSMNWYRISTDKTVVFIGYNPRTIQFSIGTADQKIRAQKTLNPNSLTLPHPPPLIILAQQNSSGTFTPLWMYADTIHSEQFSKLMIGPISYYLRGIAPGLEIPANDHESLSIAHGVFKNTDKVFTAFHERSILVQAEIKYNT